ncbi:hypothetical protein BDD12DRAFT_888772 [Trichophaea hybrida]|nr:hypothetical protein BDD12DRAFT_888772 [Trichophaea hybrida]
MSDQPRSPGHVCYICNSAFLSQSDLTTHQAACLNKAPVSLLVPKMKKESLPTPPSTPAAKPKQPVSRRKVSSVSQEQCKEQMPSSTFAKRPMQPLAPSTVMPPTQSPALAKPSNLSPRPDAPRVEIPEAAQSTPSAPRHLPKENGVQVSAQIPQQLDRHQLSGASPRGNSEDLERLYPFPICSSCRRAFLTTEALDHHLRESPRHNTHARIVSTEQLPLRCQRCDNSKVYMNGHALEQHTREKHANTVQPQKSVNSGPQAETLAERQIGQNLAPSPAVGLTMKTIRKSPVTATYEGDHGVETTDAVTQVDATVDASHPKKQVEARVVPDPVYVMGVAEKAPGPKKQAEAKHLVVGVDVTMGAPRPKKQVEAKALATLNPAASVFEPGKTIKVAGESSTRSLASTPMHGTDNSNQLRQQVLYGTPGQGNNLWPGASSECITQSHLNNRPPQFLEPPELSGSKSKDSDRVAQPGDIRKMISAPENGEENNSAKRRKFHQSAQIERAASSVSSAASRKGIMSRIAPSLAGSAMEIVDPYAADESHDESMELVPVDISPKVNIFKELKAVAGTPWTSITYLRNKWSMIPEDHGEIHLKVLNELCHSPGELLRCNFTLEPYRDEIIKFMQKCYTCSHNYLTPECTFHPGNCEKEFNQETRKIERHYSCCRTVDLNKQKGRKPGCIVLKSHNFEDFKELVNNYAFATAPHPEAGQEKHKAVVLDCEMGGTHFSRSELILLTVIDFFTAEVLINNYVRPSVQILDWRTEYSGVTEAHMNQAIAEGECIDGWRAARDLLCTFIDTDTILMGHALNNDLDQLRLIHFRVVDSALTIPKLLNHKHSVKSLNPDAFISRQKQADVEKAAFEEQLRQKIEQEKAARRDAEDRLAEEIMNLRKWDPEQRRLLKALLDTGITFETLLQEIQRVEHERKVIETK